MVRHLLASSNQPVRLTDSNTSHTFVVEHPRVQSGEAVIDMLITNTTAVDASFKLDFYTLTVGMQGPTISLQSAVTVSGNSTLQINKLLHNDYYGAGKYNPLVDTIMVVATKISGSTTLEVYGAASFR